VYAACSFVYGDFTLACIAATQASKIKRSDPWKISRAPNVPGWLGASQYGRHNLIVQQPIFFMGVANQPCIQSEGQVFLAVGPEERSDTTVDGVHAQYIAPYLRSGHK